MDDYKALITEAREHIEVYDFDKLEEGSWPWTMRHLVDGVKALVAETETLRADNFDSLRSRIAALEAVIERVRELWAGWLIDSDAIDETLTLAPSVVLDQMIREAKAEAWDRGAEDILRDLRIIGDEDWLSDQSKALNPYRNGDA